MSEPMEPNATSKTEDTSYDTTETTNPADSTEQSPAAEEAVSSIEDPSAPAEEPTGSTAEPAEFPEGAVAPANTIINTTEELSHDSNEATLATSSESGLDQLQQAKEDEKEDEKEETEEELKEETKEDAASESLDRMGSPASPVEPLTTSAEPPTEAVVVEEPSSDAAVARVDSMVLSSEPKITSTVSSSPRGSVIVASPTSEALPAIAEGKTDSHNHDTCAVYVAMHDNINKLQEEISGLRTRINASTNMPTPVQSLKVKTMNLNITKRHKTRAKNANSFVYTVLLGKDVKGETAKLLNVRAGLDPLGLAGEIYEKIDGNHA
jgi:hypothetical protein